jgi:DNA-binding GntR family transcriptional regulator
LSIPAISVESYVEVAEMRKLLEARATFLACQRASDEGIDEVRAVHMQLVEASPTISAPRVMRLNQQFHFCVYRLAQSELLLQTIIQLWLRAGPHLSHLLDRHLEQPGSHGALKYFRAHEALVKALINRDAQAAVAAIVADIDGGTALFLESMRVSELAGAALSLVAGPTTRRKGRTKLRVLASA